VAVYKFMRKFRVMNNDHLHNVPLTKKADKSQCSNLQDGKAVISAIISCGVPHSIPRTQLAINRQKLLNHPIFLSELHVVQ
jgi:hypothetical protein